MKISKFTIRFFFIIFLNFLFLAFATDLSFEKNYRKSQIIHNYRTSPTADVAIVPGASVIRSRPSIVLRDRLECAWQLYKHGKVKKILLSGDNGSGSYNEVKPMLQFMLNKKVRERDIFVDHAGFRTLDTLYRARYVFQVKSAIIVTQRFHQPRALFLAKNAGIHAYSFESDLRVYKNRRFNRSREFLARTLAWADAYLFHTTPKFFGKPFPVSGDGRPTWKGSVL